MRDLACAFCSLAAGTSPEGCCCLRCGAPIVACALCVAKRQGDLVEHGRRKGIKAEVVSQVAGLALAIGLEVAHAQSGRCARPLAKAAA